MVSWETFNPIWALIFTAALGALTAWIGYRKKKVDDEAKELRARVADLELKLAGISQQVIPLSAAMTAIFIKELTHLHTPEMDALLVKYGPPSTLTEEDWERLKEMLRERAYAPDPEVPQYERDAAIMLPMMMKRALSARDQLNHLGLLTIATVRISDLLKTEENPT